MAAAQSDSDHVAYSFESDNSSSDSSSSDGEFKKQGPCRYYNKGHCKYGDKCLYEHVCKHALEGKCRYGSKCKLNHPRVGRPTSHPSSRALNRSNSREINFAVGQYYQWQLDDGSGWKDIENDHIIEALYCLPQNKSIKIYNTPYGAVSIDFLRMRVYGKNLRVRRRDDGASEWIWYCTVNHKWIKYGDKDSKGSAVPVKSSDIEQKFQSNPTGSFPFNIGAETFEIRFREMRQVSSSKKRKVTRRPLYRPRPAGAAVSQTASALQSVFLNSRSQWQFQGSQGRWHAFNGKNGSLTTSDDIETLYQQNPHGSMIFKVQAEPYKLDFAAMTQINQSNKKTRKIRRVLL